MKIHEFKNVYFNLFSSNLEHRNINTLQNRWRSVDHFH